MGDQEIHIVDPYNRHSIYPFRGSLRKKIKCVSVCRQQEFAVFTIDGSKLITSSDC